MVNCGPFEKVMLVNFSKSKSLSEIMTFEKFILKFLLNEILLRLRTCALSDIDVKIQSQKWKSSSKFWISFKWRQG